MTGKAKAKTKKAAEPVPSVWENRIVGSGAESPEQLLANPLNYRRHTNEQRNALRQMLEQVGWVQNVVVNQTTGHLIDGHLRVDLAMQDGEAAVPVVYVRLDEREERLALAGLDPLSALAVPDSDALASLLDGIDVDGLGDELAGMLNGLMELPPLPPDDHGPGSDDGSGDKGSNLALVDVSLRDPKHQPKRGSTWKLGQHLLYVGAVHEDWPTWAPLLEDGFLFAPYPSPMLAAIYTGEKRLLLVQPDAYLAGHVLDKWASLNDDPVQVAG